MEKIKNVFDIKIHLSFLLYHWERNIIYFSPGWLKYKNIHRVRQNLGWEAKFDTKSARETHRVTETGVYK